MFLFRESSAFGLHIMRLMAGQMEKKKMGEFSPRDACRLCTNWLKLTRFEHESVADRSIRTATSISRAVACEFESGKKHTTKNVQYEISIGSVCCIGPTMGMKKISIGFGRRQRQLSCAKQQQQKDAAKKKVSFFRFFVRRFVHGALNVSIWA